MTNPVSARPASHTLPGDWAADLAACTVTFAVRNFGLRTVTGQIPLTSATVTVGPGGQPAAIRAELDARAIDPVTCAETATCAAPGSSPPTGGPRSPSKPATSKRTTPAGRSMELSPSKTPTARSSSTSPDATSHQAIRRPRSTCAPQGTWTAAQRA